VFTSKEPIIQATDAKPIRITRAQSPPLSYQQACEWLKSQSKSENLNKKNTSFMSQIEGPTQKFSCGYDAKMPVSSQLSSHDNLTLFSLEFFGDCRDELISDPNHDQVLLVSWSFLSSINGQEIETSGTMIQRRVEHGRFKQSQDIVWVLDEDELFHVLIDTINKLDPDILCGYEIESKSWGYLQERAEKAFQLNLARSISRSLNKRNLPSTLVDSTNPFASKRTSTFQVHGRICLNIWRIMNSELTLRSYSFENVAFHALHINPPKYRQPLLRDYFFSLRYAKIIDYFRLRADGNVELLVRLEVLNRTCEFARLFGVDFFSVISRGSQYKVESLMIRLAHLDNFLAYSPSKSDVVQMRAPEALPVVMEPKSDFYVDPVVVLDFQALYPSIIIAYNYCFTTCLGRVNALEYPKQYGANFEQNCPDDFHLNQVGSITISPNKVAFVKNDIREGILPKMLTELLEARVAVKSELAKETDPMRKKVLNARQLGIKYISNVTYGYTSAAFSGRMPCIEIADSIVQTGRSTLELAVKWIESHPDWDAHVVYGDTDRYPRLFHL